MLNVGLQIEETVKHVPSNEIALVILKKEVEQAFDFTTVTQFFE